LSVPYAPVDSWFCRCNKHLVAVVAGRMLPPIPEKTPAVSFLKIRAASLANPVFVND